VFASESETACRRSSEQQLGVSGNIPKTESQRDDSQIGALSGLELLDGFAGICIELPALDIPLDLRIP